jgi:hypothetical protein
MRWLSAWLVLTWCGSGACECVCAVDSRVQAHRERLHAEIAAVETQYRAKLAIVEKLQVCAIACVWRVYHIDVCTEHARRA